MASSSHCEVYVISRDIGAVVMKWTVSNALGALFWVAGLCYAKDQGPSVAALLPDSDHRLLIGAVVGSAGLLVLLWSNLRNPA